MKNPFARFAQTGAVLAWLTAAALCCIPVTHAHAQDDEDPEFAYINYLNKHGLPSAQCLQYSPGDLMIRIGNRHHFIERDLAGEQGTIEVFFKKYRAALQPALDARHPEARTMRAPLCELLDTLYDFRQRVDHHNHGAGHDRIAAYVEHMMAVLYEDEDSRPTPMAARIHPTLDEVAAFARIKDSVENDGQPVDFNAFAGDVRKQLAAVEKAALSRNVLDIRMLVLNFIENYNGLVEWPDIDASGGNAAAPRASITHDDHTFENLLLKTPLTVEQIDRRSPKSLQELFWEQNNFGDMTPAYAKKVDHLFYKQYLGALRPVIDASPKAKAMRQPLRDLLGTIFDFTNSAGAHPLNSVISPCMDAYAEYILMYRFLPDAGEEMPEMGSGETSDSTNADIVLFARLKAALAARSASGKLPSLERYSAKLAGQLHALESATAPADPSTVLNEILDFIDEYPDLL